MFKTGKPVRLDMGIRPKCLANINGKLVPYDACAKDRNAYPACKRRDWKYLGRGTIHSMDGRVQKFEDVLHFWRRREAGERVRFGWLRA